METADVAIIGGGPAGAAVACRLAETGRAVLLIEKSAGPHHKVCGEFLSVETCADLARLGIDARALGAVPIGAFALRSDARERVIALPFPALSLSRYRLDEALLARAVALGADVRRGSVARAVEPCAGGWRVRLGDESALDCGRLVLATGKHAIRGFDDFRDRSMVGLKMHLRPSRDVAAALAGRVELFLVGGGYVGLEPVEDGIANLCLVLPSAEVARLDPGWPALQAYLAARALPLAERLTGVEPVWEKPLAVVCPSGGHLPTRADSQDGLFRVGDRLAHIPPFTGDGIAIALSTAALAAAHLMRGDSAAAYDDAARRMIAAPIRRARAVAWLAQRDIGRAVLSGVTRRAPGLMRAMARATRVAGAPP
jgi:flavin-dependent dehydrogenase